MHLTPSVLKASYEYLKACPPFSRWGLPDGDSIEWHVINKKDIDGFCTEFKKGAYRIEINANKIKATETLMATMAHEMVHIRLFMQEVKALHGYEFKRLAKMVCKEHGFREELF
mgnify:CR=1 FL=1